MFWAVELRGPGCWTTILPNSYLPDHYYTPGNDNDTSETGETIL